MYIHTVNLTTREFVSKYRSCSSSLGRKWEDIILPGLENPGNCVVPDEMKMIWGLCTPGSPEYVLPVSQSTSVTPVSPYSRRRSVTMYLEALILRGKRCTWRPWSSKFGDALWGRDQASVEIHFEAVIEQVRCWNSRPWLSELGGRRDGNWDSIRWLTCNFGKVESWVQQHPQRDGKLDGSWKLAASGRLSILGWCCSWCMLYSVLSHDHGMER